MLRLKKRWIHPEDKDSQRVFDLLSSKGPRCPSQISAELFISLKRVNDALLKLEKAELVARRLEGIDKKTLDILGENAVEMPWGVITLRMKAVH